MNLDWFCSVTLSSCLQTMVWMWWTISKVCCISINFQCNSELKFKLREAQRKADTTAQHLVNASQSMLSGNASFCKHVLLLETFLNYKL